MSSSPSNAAPQGAIDVGASGSVELTVTSADTAIAFRSGDVPVLATPRVLALVEEAACVALEGSLPSQMTSVGVRAELDHIQATQVGATVTAVATVTGVEGRKLDFSLIVSEGDTEVARGTHRRVIARREVFTP